VRKDRMTASRIEHRFRDDRGGLALFGVAGKRKFAL
jgi:hypothetical protein